MMGEPVEAVSEVVEQDPIHPTAIDSPFSMHPEVRNRAVEENTNFIRGELLSGIWYAGCILPRHRYIFLLGKMRAHISVYSTTRAIMDLFHHPETYDAKARAAMDELATLFDSIMEREDYDIYGSDEESDSRRGDGIVGTPQWNSIASQLLESDTFSKMDLPPSNLYATIPIAISAMVMDILNPARTSHGPPTGTLGERVDAMIVEEHRDVMWDVLRWHWDQLYHVIVSPSYPHRGEGDSNPWRGVISPEVARELFLLLGEWVEDRRAHSETPGVLYYNEHAGRFTVENIHAFGEMISEYNAEWAMAAMEWK